MPYWDWRPAYNLLACPSELFDFLISNKFVYVKFHVVLHFVSLDKISVLQAVLVPVYVTRVAG